MATDKNGKTLKVGDHVLVPAVVTRVGDGKVTLRIASPPSSAAAVLTFDAAALVRSDVLKPKSPIGPGTSTQGPHDQ